ncbi:hypothetical protein [Micromonospora carbonacea]|uniref:Uncharacterized protein n=1 Tax=Micromonospora carbonacea TaxID=47853 RepID=A0A7H8XGJ8_9ACTN|nr:hypothetical protein [Micromonospora carbonacea]MBB5828598.1 hypothetical protein [Micromonospora carbonacea]QLD23814.1 hypothetical protein HXZ27_05985 [Micromonospora carbonacea]
MKRIVLEPLFLHAELVSALLGRNRVRRSSPASLRETVEGALSDSAPTAYELAEMLGEALPQLNIHELQRIFHEGSLRVGTLVAIEQEFTFARDRSLEGPGSSPMRFTAPMSTDADVHVHGIFNAERLAAASTAGNLVGEREVFVLGTIVRHSGRSIEIRPSFIGIRSYVKDDLDALFGVSESLRVYPSEIDQFSGVDFATPCTPSELQALHHTSEDEVKRSIAALIGEPFVAKDWGGEKSDLYTSRTSIRGNHVASAWLFKGPGANGPMTVRTLGKRGDQIDRLYSEPADLLVLQHYREIATAVVNMMSVYAHQMSRPRKFMILDGEDTAKILRAIAV